MQNNELKAKMDKQIGVSLTALNWFLLSTYLKSVFTDPEKVKATFSDAGDCQAIELIAASIAKQLGINLENILKTEEEESTLEAILKVEPKKLLTTGSTLIV